MYVWREFEGVEEEEILPASPEDPAAAARAAFFLASNAASFPELSSSAMYEWASSFGLKHGIRVPMKPCLRGNRF